MFGQNEVAPKRQDENTLLVNSVFYTIQGEGARAGTPALFIRLAGCNLRCFFCDTDFSTNHEFTPAQLCEWVSSFRAEYPFDLIVITGGEPLLQNLLPLLQRLVKMGFHFEIETAGTLWLPGLESFISSTFDALDGNYLIVSPKTKRINDEVLNHAAIFKYVVRADKNSVSEIDGLPLVGTQPQDEGGGAVHIARPVILGDGKLIFVQPMDQLDEVKNKANRELAADIVKRHGYRLSLQMHKLVGID